MSSLDRTCRLRNRGTSKRTHVRPEGMVQYKSVREGNWIAARTLILCYICAALQCWWILEQPVNSFMQELPAFRYFMRNVATFRHSINMKDYGGKTLKPTWLYSGTFFQELGPNRIFVYIYIYYIERYYIYKKYIIYKYIYIIYKYILSYSNIVQKF